MIRIEDWHPTEDEIAAGKARHDARQHYSTKEIAEAKARYDHLVPDTVQVGSMEIVPWDLNAVMHSETPIDGADLLFETAAVLAYYARWNSRAELLLTATWIAGTHWRTATGDPAFRVFPIWGVVGDKDSGKTRKQELIQALAYHPSDIESFPTEFAVREMLSHNYTTIIDELHQMVGNGNGMRRAQTLIRSAYKMGAGSAHAKGGGLNQNKIFTPVAVAFLPRFLTHTNGFVEDMVDRMMPLVVSEQSADKIPEQDNDYELITSNLANRLAAWGAQQMVFPTPENKHPTLWPIHTVPEELSSRKRELANFYFAVADRAVSPEVVAEFGSDTRWAIMIREAVLEQVNGVSDDPAEAVVQVQAKLEELGILKLKGKLES